MAEMIPATKLTTGDYIMYDGCEWKLLDGVRNINEMEQDDFDAHFDHLFDVDHDHSEMCERELDYNFQYEITFEAVSRNGEHREFSFCCDEEVAKV